MSVEEPLMTVATFDSLMEAEMARSYLESEGIPCFLADAEMVNTAWYLSGAMGGIKLQVTKSDFLAAERLMHSRPTSALRGLDDYGLKRGTDAITAAPGQVRQPPEEDKEEEEVPQNEAEALVSRALRAAILGLFLCPPCLHVYSMGLLYEARNRPESLRDSYQKDFWIAGVLDAIVMLTAAAVPILFLMSAMSQR
jgi:hypothetical protein